MKVIEKILFGTGEKGKSADFFWNMCASVVYSFQSAILLFAVTRISGLFVAGIFSISYIVSQTFAVVGSYSMRNYQVSDMKNKYSYGTYIYSRIISTIIMFVTCMVYSLLEGYTGEKLVLIAILCVYRAVDGYEDVYHGEMQKRNRLDVASRIVTYRIVISSVIFAIGVLCTNNIIFSTALLTISAVLLSWGMNTVAISVMDMHQKPQKNQVWKLLFEVAPICIGAFLYNYLVNSPKYAIENILSDDMQTIFNIIFMPVFVINMLSSFVFKPYVARMGIYWNDKNQKKFIKLLLLQAGCVLGITAIVMLAGFILGIPVLEFIYGVDLKQYKLLFMMLLAFGGVTALDAFALIVLTVMRLQNIVLASYIVSLIVDVIFMNSLVIKYHMMGAGLVYGMSMVVILLVSLVGIGMGLVQMKKE